MEVRNGGPVLVIDDDKAICSLFEDAISMWEMKCDSVCDPIAALDCLKMNEYEVVFIDVYLPVISGLELIPQITKYCPSSKIIIMTGHADKEIAIKALRLGAFDFLEKPFEAQILYHVLQRALDARQSEQQQITLLEELKESQQELTEHKMRLEHLNTQLMETNKALTIFAQNIDRERENVQKRIVLRLKSVVAPAIEGLKRDKNLAKYGAELDGIIRSMIEELMDDMSTEGKIASILSFTELRIASLIKNGLTTDEIADQLNVSPSTVRTHRKNIRKKLKINNAQYSLRNFLLSKSQNTMAHNS